MKSSIFLFSILLLLASCNNDDAGNRQAPTKSGEAQQAQTNKALPDLSGCYLRVLKRDTLALSIQQSGKTVSGRLSFDNFEKDGSTGPVTGTIDSNILKLIYSFQSEGMHSVMEVYFKIEDSALIHGIGEIAVRSDTAYYANPASVTYPRTDRLEKISCDQLDPKFR